MVTATTSGSGSSDAELVQAWRDGDERGATELVRRHAPAVTRFLDAAGAPGADLDDLVQETFVRAFRALDTWEGRGGLRSWLISIASNRLKDHARWWKRRPTVPLDEADPPSADGPMARLEAREAARALRSGLVGLSRLQREVFVLRAQEGMDYEAIAGVLGTTAGAARVHYHHAVRRLKELIP